MSLFWCIFAYKWSWSPFLMFNGNLSKSVFNCLFISLAHIFYWIVKTLCKLRKLALCHMCCKYVLDLIAITKWHTDWEFKLFFYIYKKYSLRFNLLPAQNQRGFKDEKESLSCSLVHTSCSCLPTQTYGNGVNFRWCREMIYISFSFRLSLQLLQKTIMNLIIPPTNYIRIRSF